MSISGLFLILFLLFHMSMNLVAVFSAEAYDMICGALGANWYALAGTAVLAGGFIVHVVYATILTLKNQKARGEQGYAYTNAPKEVSFASRNMGVLGSIVLLGLLLHMAMFWYKMQFLKSLDAMMLSLETRSFLQQLEPLSFSTTSLSLLCASFT
jgi:succinate dehydrogenase / fumarate reductase cytochrome b subunit